MTSTTRPHRSNPAQKPGSAGRPPSGGASRRTIWIVAIGVVAVLVVVGVLVAQAFRGNQASQQPQGVQTGSAPTVGGDLHTVAALEDALYVGGHAAAAVSTDDGRTWSDIPSLQGADAMGWAVTSDAILAGGHPGLFGSDDGGATFSKMPTPFADVHGLGGAGDTAYAASPESGLLVSTDGGANWEVRNAEVGRSFMGTILVDPADPARLIAPDMAGALAVSTDGGATWSALGGPSGAMAAAWNPSDTDEIIAVGMSGSARTTDGGATWEELGLPRGASAVSYAEDGSAIYAGVLSGVQAVTYVSTDGGSTWSPTL